MNNNRANMEKYVWYILKYHKDFNGNMSDDQCIRKIDHETNDVSIVDFVMYRNALRDYSKQDIELVLMELERRGWV